MAEITLADYAGYIFLEIIRAREMADHYSREVARRYGQDEVMRHFSVPRFKVPKMDLTIPVLISGARFKQVLRLKLAPEEFAKLVEGRLREVVKTVQLYKSSVFDLRPTLVAQPLQPLQPGQPPRPGVLRPGGAVAGTPRSADGLPEAIAEFHQQLRDNPDLSQPGQIVMLHWARLFKRVLEAEDLWALYQKHNPNDELFRKTSADLLRLVQASTIVERTTIDNLLINPETQQVKDGSSDSSVFTIRAEMLEEGFFIRSVKDEATGTTQQVVEFE